LAYVGIVQANVDIVALSRHVSYKSHYFRTNSKFRQCESLSDYSLFSFLKAMMSECGMNIDTFLSNNHKGAGLSVWLKFNF